MTKFIAFIAFVIFASCNSQTSTTPTDSGAAGKTDTSKKEVTYPYAIGYSSQFEFSDPEKSKMVLQLWKDFDNNTLDNVKDKFADSVLMKFPDMVMHTTRDSAIASTKAYRNTLLSVTSTVDVVMSVKSTDKNDEWVLVWGNEIHTDKKNKTDTIALHEVWGLDKNGKINFMQQYMSHK